MGDLGAIEDIKGLRLTAHFAQFWGDFETGLESRPSFWGQKRLPNCLVLKVRCARGVGAVPF
ncbi:MAG: hypothetical protein A2178_00080 [Planctomycetes bacterium GWC2_49_10]|nr:MAG: hypothetical protein A2178_00080 [Planctomycetes bacterium GWC2_49_10]